MGGPAIFIQLGDLEQGSPRHDEKDSCQDQGEMGKVPQSAYLDEVVRPKLQYRSWLQVLDRFMDPTAKGFAVDLSHRMHHFDLQVMHISRSGRVSSVTGCSSPEAFQHAMQEDQERTSTLIIAKGLSQVMIDTLGMQYDLEPEFFASHLGGTETYGMGHRVPPASRPPARSPNLLPDYIRNAPFYSIEYRRPYHIKGGRKRVLELRVSETSTPRGAQVLNDSLPDVFYFEKISIYEKRASKIGIILTDQLLSYDPPASYILNPVTSSDDDLTALGPNGRHTQVSARRELTSWVQRQAPSTVAGLFTSPGPLALAAVLKIVECNSAMFITHARCILNRILTRYCDDTFPDSIPFFLGISRSLHRHIHDQQRLLRYALRIADLRAAGGDDVDGAGCGDGGGGGVVAIKKRDLAFLMDDLQGVLKSLEEDVRFLVAAESIREGKIVGWVSKFAALFLPVSLLATILAISDPGYTRWAILGGLSVPFVIVSVFLMFFWNPAHLDTLRF